MKKLIGLILILILAFVLISPSNSVQAGATSAISWRILNPVSIKIDTGLQQTLKAKSANQMTTVIVSLRQQTDLSSFRGEDRLTRNNNVIRALKDTADRTQINLRNLFKNRQRQSLVKNFEPLWIINGFSLTATSAVINELASEPDVFSITPDDIQIVPTFGSPEPNVSYIDAPALWNLGYTGQRVVVASMDSGVDISHPDLATRWRGGTNSWFDPYGQHVSTPVDLSGHGTWTTGVMVGGDAGGTIVGIAPNAQWIGVKIFNDAGSATATAIHLGFQWLLDPDGNPATADAPDVVNNSWTYGAPGCNLEFELDLQSLRSAGILPVFAAGNGGPYANTSYSPANNPSAFSVGAINNTGGAYGLSSRGPSACSGSGLVYPDVVAPGVNIRTTDLYGGYYNVSGTSLSSPHVAGILALLLSAYPNLSANDQEKALEYSAFDLGAVGPDNTYGYGRVDALSAFNWVANAPTFTSTPTQLPATSTPTPLPPTATPTALPPTYTPTQLPPTNTPTQLPPTITPTAVKTIHVGDLLKSTSKSGTKWNASVTILVHFANEQLAANTTVTGRWSNGATGTFTCLTNSSGICTISKTSLSSSVTSVTFTVSNLSLSGYTYTSSTNHDPNGDSNGTTIIVTKP